MILFNCTKEEIIIFEELIKKLKDRYWLFLAKKYPGKSPIEYAYKFEQYIEKKFINEKSD